MRRALSRQYRLSELAPDIKVWRADRRGDRSLTLRHTRHERRPLASSADDVLRHVAALWGFTVRLEEVDGDGRVDNLREAKAA